MGLHGICSPCSAMAVFWYNSAHRCLQTLLQFRQFLCCLFLLLLRTSQWFRHIQFSFICVSLSLRMLHSLTCFSFTSSSYLGLTNVCSYILSELQRSWMLQHIASTGTNSVSPRRTLPSVSQRTNCAPYLPSAQPSPGPLDSKHIEAKPYCFSVSLASR